MASRSSRWPGSVRASQVVLGAVGLITATPAIALFAPGDLKRQYAVDLTDPTVQALLQHRGALQGVLGAALVVAAWRPRWIVPASVAAVATKSVFLALVVGNADVRDGFPALPLVFDAVAVALLVGVSTTASPEGGPAGR